MAFVLAGAATLARAAPSLEDYSRSWETNGVRLSPSGERYAYTVTQDGKVSLMVATTDGAPPVAINVGAAEIVSLGWAGDDRLLVAVSGIGKLGPGFTQDKARMQQINVFNLRTHTAFRVFEHKDNQVASIVEGSYGVRQVDGHWYGYFGGMSQDRGAYTLGPATLRDLYRVDLDTGDIKMLSRGSDQQDNWIIGPNGEVVAREQSEWQTGAWKVFAGPVNGRLLASGRSKLKEGAVALGQTPDELLLARPTEAGDHVTFQRLPLSGAAPTDIPDLDSDASAIVVDTENGLWIGTTTKDDRPQVQFFSPALEAKVHAIYAAFPNQTVELKSWSDDFSKVVVFITGADSGTYYLVDMTTHKADPVGYAYPNIAPEDVGPVRMIDYQAGDGLPLHAVLTLPPGRPAKALPLVVLPHEAMTKRGYPVFVALAQALASRGYAVVQPNTRGSTGYGLVFASAAFGQLGRKTETDIADAVAALASQGMIDPKRVCIIGSGWGGYSALAGVTIEQGLYRCAVSVDGIADLRELVAATEANTLGVTSATRLVEDMVGAKSLVDPELGAMSPVKLAGRADAPVLLIYKSAALGRVTNQSQQMAAALRRAGKPVDELVLPPDGDAAELEASQIAMFKAAVAFIELHNPSDAPAQAAVASAGPAKN